MLPASPPLFHHHSLSIFEETSHDCRTNLNRAWQSELSWDFQARARAEQTARSLPSLTSRGLGSAR